MKSTSKISLKLTINGVKQSIETYPMARLVDILREKAKYTGTKEGCGEGECGACSVLLNGELVNSCLIPAIQAEGADITTIEGIAQGDQLSAIQEAFVETGGVQCGICTPGMVMATVYLLRNNPTPSETDIREALAGNICRCTGYMKIFEAVSHACRKTGVIQ